MAYRLIFCLFFLPVILFGQRIDVQKITVRENIVLRGRSIDSFSVDGTFNSPSNLEIPTQKAIYDYISGITAGLAYLPIQGGTLTGTAGAGFLGLPPQASAPSAPVTGASVYADASGRVSWIRPDGYTRTIDASTITASRVWNFPDVAGTVVLREGAETLTGIKTFAPTGSGSAGFIYSSTARPAHPFGSVTTAQMNAMTGMAAGDGVYNATTKRFNLWDVSWLSIPTMPTGGIGNTQVVRGDATGNLMGDAGLVYNVFLATNPSSGNTGFRVSPTGLSNRGLEVDFSEGNDRPIIQAFGTNSYLKFKAPSNAIVVEGALIMGTSNNSGFFTSSAAQSLTGASNSFGWFNNVNGRTIALSHSSSNVDPNTKAFIFNAEGAMSSATDFLLAQRVGVALLAVGTLGDVAIGGGARTGATLTIYGDRSIASASWGANGVGARIQAATYTNTTGTGTVASQYTHTIARPTFASTSAVTVTNAATLYIANAPLAGTNTTITNAWGIYGFGGFRMQSNGSALVEANDNGSLTLQSSNNSGVLIKSTSGGGTITLNTASANIFQTRASSGTTFNNAIQLGREDGTGGVVTFGVANSGSFTRGLIGLSSGSSYPDFGIVTVNDNSPAAGQRGGHMIIKGGTGAASHNGGNAYIYGGTPASGTGYGNVIIAYDFIASAAIGRVGIGTNSPNASALVDMASTALGLLIPRGTDANIAAVAAPPVMWMMASTTSERINLKRTDGLYQIAYTQDVKRDSTYKTVNANLDLSALTTTFKTRFHTVRIKTIVTAAAAGNNTITMPAPTVDLLGISFKVSTEDTSGDGDISVLSFGTDGADGYLYNGDGTYGLSLNLFPGLGVYLSVAWCEAKSAYRWELQ